MSDMLYYVLCGFLIFGILGGIALMSKVKYSVKGNLLSSICVTLAIIITLYKYNIMSDYALWICIIAGLIVGLIGAYKVKMIDMPQTVAILNGFGGAASAIVAAISLLESHTTDVFSYITGGLALSIGMITLIGSLVAAGKLQGLLSQKPVVWKKHSIILSSLLFITVVSILAMTFMRSDWTILSVMILFCLITSGLFGVAFTVRVGGADMPITISLLNSLSGVAGSIAGMVISDPLLIAVGGIVGASGLLLTQIMCKAMNRSLNDILLGKSTVRLESVKNPQENIDRKIKPESTQNLQEDNEQEINQESSHNPLADFKQEINLGSLQEPQKNNKNETKPEKVIQKADLAEIIAAAKKVIIVPGYGMALAQAQELVKQLSDKLEGKGAEVLFAIHPVAGRMPGHMNVLLCEVDIPYEKLCEMDEINPQFKECDLAVVIGANDVVNPAANTAEGTPIYGMPILEVDRAKHVIICNFDLKPGYSGVENPLYQREEGVTLLIGDAKDTIKKLISVL
ncbi:MAG: NAD(P)(+) transhydrogenase (Re/Si-specific) subunit beta [Ruminiclostridium sp.]|nr:NAD(P)(+) transhydrogenase (Re/Si-specific) subunit beta [Ruminiclostridium sp.]